MRLFSGFIVADSCLYRRTLYSRAGWRDNCRMSWIEIVADRKIREAQDEGLFDNLPGKGQPLRLDFDPRVPLEQRAAYRLMKEAELLPDWIQLDKEIRGRQQQWEARIDEFIRHHVEELEGYAASGSLIDAGLLEESRECFLLRAARDLQELNRQIDRFNLIVPVPSRQRHRINIRERMADLEAQLPRVEPEASDAQPGWLALLDETQPPPTRLSNRMPRRRRRGTIG
jgi:DnaJ-like protein